MDICPSVTLFNPRIWGGDVDEVDPTRWERLRGDQQNPYAFSPFSNGVSTIPLTTRFPVCLGMEKWYCSFVLVAGD